MSKSEFEKELVKFLPKVLVEITSSYIAWCSNCKLELPETLTDYGCNMCRTLNKVESVCILSQNDIDNIAKYLQY